MIETKIPKCDICKISSFKTSRAELIKLSDMQNKNKTELLRRYLHDKDLTDEHE